MADIMRGVTDPNETLGAQQLKTQYGSSRIRDKQGELARLARDLVEITSEIMCSDFEFTTLMQMSQMEIPTLAEQDQKILAIQQQLAMMTMQAQQQMQQQQAAPQAQGMAQASAPNQSPQLQQQFTQMQGNLEDEQAKPTQEAIAQFIKDYRTTAFVLDIETDSTIQANEDAEKQRRAEFMGMMAQLLPQLAALIAQEPGSAEFCGELLKFSVAPFRVGRSLDGSVDNLIQQVEAQASQRVGQPDPKTQADQQKVQTMAQLEIAKMQQQKASDDAANALEMTKINARHRPSRPRSRATCGWRCWKPTTRSSWRWRALRRRRSRRSRASSSTRPRWPRRTRRWRLPRSWRSKSRWTRSSVMPTWRHARR